MSKTRALILTNELEPFRTGDVVELDPEAGTGILARELTAAEVERLLAADEGAVQEVGR